MKKKLMILLILSLILTSCFPNKKNTSIIKEKNNVRNTLPTSVWAVYWDIEQAPTEIESMKDSIEEISYFAAYFNKDNELFIPENIAKLHLSLKDRIKDNNILHYLSIVNDKINEEGSSSLKDRDLLYDLLTKEENKEQHIDKILSLCLENGYDGIEIDYEGLKNDEILWLYFLEFCDSLWETLDSYGLNMRIILEPSTPIDEYDFPHGPTYVMMCYNLHGSHSGPGPKANREFLQKLSQKMKKITGNINFALATGGFDWDSQGKVISLTKEEAIKLIKIYDAKPIRDDESYSIFFNYKDDKDIEHEVWFADDRTLDYWMDILKIDGHKKFSLWRLGGNM